MMLSFQITVKLPKLRHARLAETAVKKREQLRSAILDFLLPDLKIKH